MVPTGSFNEESRQVMWRLVLERFGPRMHAVVQMASAIEPGPSGKYRFTIYAVEEGSRKGAADEHTGGIPDHG